MSVEGFKRVVSTSISMQRSVFKPLEEVFMQSILLLLSLLSFFSVADNSGSLCLFIYNRYFRHFENELTGYIFCLAAQANPSTWKNDLLYSLKFLPVLPTQFQVFIPFEFPGLCRNHFQVSPFHHKGEMCVDLGLFEFVKGRSAAAGYYEKGTIEERHTILPTHRGTQWIFDPNDSIDNIQTRDYLIKLGCGLWVLDECFYSS